MTSFVEQAEKWALRKTTFGGGIPIVSIYQLSDELSELKVKRFEEADEEWLDFVLACRDGEEINKQYDLVIGRVANDDVFKTIDMFKKGIWSKKKVLSELRYYKKNDQYCLVNQDIITNNLIFLDSYKVKLND